VLPDEAERNSFEDITCAVGQKAGWGTRCQTPRSLAAPLR